MRQIGDRGVTTDEVNRTIDKLCRENDINIAFNQLEVHLHNEKGDQIEEIKTLKPNSDNSPDKPTEN